MKLLLTSAGITNKSIEDAFRGLVGKPFNEVLVAFVPTASNILDGDKWWVIKDILALNTLGCKIDIVDIVALPKEMCLLRLNQADVIFIEGGDTYYLMDAIHKAGLLEEVKELLHSKVYVGISAGSAICSKDCALEASQKLYEEALDRKEDIEGLGAVPFYVFPHYGSKEWFPKVTKENVEQLVYEDSIYLIDDQSAVMVNGETVEVISEGVWEIGRAHV